MIRFIKALLIEIKQKNKISYLQKEIVNRVAEDLCFRTFTYPERKILRSKKALLTSGPLSRHILVAFRDGQRTRVGLPKSLNSSLNLPVFAEGSKDESGV